MFIFDSQPGVVGAVVTGQALPFSVLIGGTGAVPGFPAYFQAKAILTGFDHAARSGLGLAHTLRDRIYVYVFGERVGEATVSGIAFAGVCGAAGRYSGFDAVYAYYERCRASTQGALVRLVFGPDTTLYGFMSDFSFRLEDPQTGVGAFAFKFKVLPRTVAGSQGLPPLPWEPVTGTSSSPSSSLQ